MPIGGIKHVCRCTRSVGEEGRWLYLFQCSADGEPGPGPQPVIVGQIEFAGAAVELYHLTQCNGTLGRRGGKGRGEREWDGGVEREEKEGGERGEEKERGRYMGGEGGGGGREERGFG